MESRIREDRWNRWHIQEGSSPRTGHRTHPPSIKLLSKRFCQLSLDPGFQSNMVILPFVPSCTISTAYRSLLYKS